MATRTRAQENLIVDRKGMVTKKLLYPAWIILFLIAGMAVDCGVVSQEDICLVDPESCPSNGQITSYSNAALVLSAPSRDFGEVNIGGNSASITFTVSNVGAKTATLGTVTTAGLGLSPPVALTGGSCKTGGTVAPRGTCTLILTFAPSSIGSVTQALELSYVGSSGGNQVATLKDFVFGKGTTSGLVTISDGSIYSYGDVIVGLTAQKTFILTNLATGLVALDPIQNTASLGLAAPFTFVSSTCGAGTILLAGGQSCTITVQFAPSVEGAVSATISVNYTNGLGNALTANRAIQGNGVPVSSLALSGSTHFGGVLVGGSTGDLTLTLTNSGLGRATFNALTSSGLGLTGDFSLVSTSCGTSLAPGASCSLLVRFLPTSAGFASRVVTVSYFDNVSSGQTTSLAVDGTGTGPAALALSGVSDFGTLSVNSTPPDVTLTLTNNGVGTATYATLSDASLGLSAPMSLQSSTCGTSLAGLDTCTLTIRYRPTSAGTTTQLMTISYNNGVVGGQQVTQNARGTARAGAVLTLNGPLNFPTIPIGGTTPDLTLTVSNVGTIAASFTAPTTAGLGLSGDLSLQSTDCGTSLNAGATCNLVIRYLPTSASTNQTLTLTYNDANAIVPSPTVSTPVQGSAESVASLSLSNVDFGTMVPVGSSPSLDVTVTNNGGTTATFTDPTAGGITGLSAPMSVQSSDCGTSLAASASCLITISYSPIAVGPTSQNFTLTYHNGVSGGQTQTANASGTAVTPAVLAISGVLVVGGSVNFGAVQNTLTALTTLVITNTGATTGTLSAPNSANTGLTAPFSVFSTTCGNTLVSGGSCNVVISYDSDGNHASNVFTLNFGDGASAQSVSVTINAN